MTTQFKNKVVPFITKVHCFTHWTNLAVITLSNVLIMHQLEGILQSMYVFFSQFQKVCKILEACESSQHQGQQDFTKCQDPLDFNVFSFKKKLFWVQPFIVKIHVKSPKSDTTNKNLNVLYNVEVILGCHVNCHCLSVSISSARLCKIEMLLYAILWRLSSWLSLNYTSCIVIFSPSLRMLPLMISI
jgi:hypothetical protein